MYSLFVIEFCSQTINSYASISRLKKQTKNNVIPVFIKVPSTWIEKCVKFSILLIQSSLIKQVHPPAVQSVSALPQCWSSMCSKRSGDSPDHQYPTSEKWVFFTTISSTLLPIVGDVCTTSFIKLHTQKKRFRWNKLYWCSQYFTLSHWNLLT